MLDPAPAHPRAVLADAGKAVNTAYNIAGELCHEEHVAVGHDGDGAVAHRRVLVADDGGGLGG